MTDAPGGCVSATIADASLRQGLKLCARCNGLTARGVLRKLRDGDAGMHSSFRYGLAKGLSTQIGVLGSGFRGIYVYGSAIGNAANPVSDIDVLVVVKRRRDEILRLLALIDASLTSRYRRMVGLKGIPSSLLDVHVLEERCPEERTGHGAVLQGANARPICLWRSPPEATSGIPAKGVPGNRRLDTRASTVC